MLNEDSYLNQGQPNINSEKDIIELEKGIEINLQNPYINQLPELPLKVGDKFPAIVHELDSFKGRIIDRGWKIKWFDDESDAQTANEKAQKEAESLYLTKEFFHSLEGKEDKDTSEIVCPNIRLVNTKEDIMEFANIENYQFVDQALSYTYEDASDYESEVLGRSGKMKDNFNDYLIEDGKILISTRPKYGSSYNENHYYNIALKIGAIKNDLDKKIINSFNFKVNKLQEEIGQQLNQLEIFSLRLDEYLPELAGQDIQIKDALQKCKELIEGDKSISNIEEYWEVDIPFEFIIRQLNEELKKWDDFWKGSFSEIKEKDKNNEIILNYGGDFRRMGKTGCQDFWVIRSNGDSRPATSVEYRKDYLSEGRKNWDVVLSDEMAIFWEKTNTGADHFFEINKMPDRLTATQKSTIKHIQEDLEREWKDRIGMSGKRSPSVGNGWLEMIEQADVDNQDGDTITEDKLRALKNKFNS